MLSGLFLWVVSPDFILRLGLFFGRERKIYRISADIVYLQGPAVRRPALSLALTLKIYQ
jgi:hypothetical protein